MNSRQPRLGRDRSAIQSNAPTPLAARLRPRELIAMLTHHYMRARARSLPRVKTTLSVSTPRGKQAVTIGWD